MTSDQRIRRFLMPYHFFVHKNLSFQFRRQAFRHVESRYTDAVVGHSIINVETDRKSTRLNSSHPSISYAVFCLKKKKKKQQNKYIQEYEQRDIQIFDVGKARGHPQDATDGRDRGVHHPYAYC